MNARLKNQRSRELRLIAWLAAACLLICITVVALATSREYGTLVRNSLILDASVAAPLYWAPGKAPPEFLHETTPLPAPIREATGALIPQDSNASDDLDVALALARHLVTHARAGRMIRQDTESTYQRIIARGEGYCADYSQVYVALAQAAGLHVREWGLGFGGLGSGHAFNDVWLAEQGKWAFIDPFNSFYIRDRGSQVALSVNEIHTGLKQPALRARMEVMPIVPERFVFKSGEAALDYYAKGLDNYYLFLGNNVISYDRHPLVRAGTAIARDAGVLGGVIAGVHPRIRVLPTAQNRQRVQDLARLRLALFTAAVLVALLGSLLCWRIARWLRAST